MAFIYLSNIAIVLAVRFNKAFYCFRSTAFFQFNRIIKRI